MCSICRFVNMCFLWVYITDIIWKLECVKRYNETIRVIHVAVNDW